MASLVVIGGNAEFDIVWEGGTESIRIPEAILGSVQWSMLPGSATADEIRAMRLHAEQERERRTNEAKERYRKFCAEGESLQGDSRYTYLEQGKDQSSGTLAARNIRHELKKAFPGAVFFVRKRHHGSVHVSWCDGPTTVAPEQESDAHRSPKERLHQVSIRRE